MTGRSAELARALAAHGISIEGEQRAGMVRWQAGKEDGEMIEGVQPLAALPGEIADLGLACFRVVLEMAAEGRDEDAEEACLDMHFLLWAFLGPDLLAECLDGLD